MLGLWFGMYFLFSATSIGEIRFDLYYFIYMLY